MNIKWQQAGQKMKPGLKIAGRLCCLTEGRGTLAGRPGEVTRGDPRRPFRRHGMRRVAQRGRCPRRPGAPPRDIFPR